MQAWYIDSWAPLDGIAFASLREPATDIWSTDVVRASTIAMKPPFFEPEPVSLAAAFGLVRSGAQESFLADGVEVAFDTLEQLRETIRRYFIMGGNRSLDPDPGSVAPGPPRETPGGTGAEADRPVPRGDHEDRAVLSEYQSLTDMVMKLTYDGSREDVRQALTTLVSPGRPIAENRTLIEAAKFLSASATATLARAFRSDSESSFTEATAALLMHLATYFDVPTHEIDEAAHRQLAQEGLQVPDLTDFWIRDWGWFLWDAALDVDLLALATFPPSLAQRMHLPIDTRTFSDLLTVLAVDRIRFMDPDWARSFLPQLLALGIVVNFGHLRKRGPWHWRLQSRMRQQLISAALGWIAQLIPGGGLPKAVEKELYSLAQGSAKPLDKIAS